MLRVDRAAKLICTTPEFDDLTKDVGLGNHTNSITDELTSIKHLQKKTLRSIN